jgi:hypothetical protein
MRMIKYIPPQYLPAFLAGGLVVAAGQIKNPWLQILAIAAAVFFFATAIRRWNLDKRDQP